MKQIKIVTTIANIDDNSLKFYLRDIYQAKPFTAEEEYECALRAHNGDEAARNELIYRNLRFVVTVAKQYLTTNLNLADLINEGNIGLVLAVDRFQPERNLKFISYAVWWVRKLIVEYIGKNGKMIRLPFNKVQSMIKLNKVLSELEQQNGYHVNEYEAALETNDESFKLLGEINSVRMLSMDSPLSDDGDGLTLHEIINDPTAQATDFLTVNSDFKREVRESLNVLKPNEKIIIEALFGLDGGEPKTLKEVSEMVSLTRERVRQIKEKCLIKLRTNKKIVSAYTEI